MISRGLWQACAASLVFCSLANSAADAQTKLTTHDRTVLGDVGPVEQAQFSDFEAEIEVLAHTRRQLRGLLPHRVAGHAAGPPQGFEMQVNNQQPVFAGDSGDPYVENKKTGSLYGIRNAYKAMAGDNQWFTLRLRVQGHARDPRERRRWSSTTSSPKATSPGSRRRCRRSARARSRCSATIAAARCSIAASRCIRCRRAGAAGARAPNPDPAFAKRYRLARDNFPLVDLRAIDVRRTRPGSRRRWPRRRGPGLFVGVTAAAGKAELSTTTPASTPWSSGSAASRSSSACGPASLAGPRQSSPKAFANRLRRARRRELPRRAAHGRRPARRYGGGAGRRDGGGNRAGAGRRLRRAAVPAAGLARRSATRPDRGAPAAA